MATDPNIRPGLTGRANALTRGKGKKVGLKRVGRLRTQAQPAGKRKGAPKPPPVESFAGEFYPGTTIVKGTPGYDANGKRVAGNPRPAPPQPGGQADGGRRGFLPPAPSSPLRSGLQRGGVSRSSRATTSSSAARSQTGGQADGGRRGFLPRAPRKSS